MNADQVTKQLGTPQKNIQASGLEIWEYGQGVPCSAITFSDHRLASIWGTELRSKGLVVIKAGDPEALVKTRLGKPNLVSKIPKLDAVWIYNKKVNIRVRWTAAGRVKAVGLEDPKWADSLPKADHK